MLRTLRQTGLLMAASALLSFTMAPEGPNGTRLLFDVRGAFVTSSTHAPHDLMQEIQWQVSAAIGGTVRRVVAPRVVLVIHLKEIERSTMLFWSRDQVRVSVEAASVPRGDVIARADFDVSALTSGDGMERDALAGKIAARIMSEFKLVRPTAPLLASAVD